VKIFTEGQVKLTEDASPSLIHDIKNFFWGGVELCTDTHIKLWCLHVYDIVLYQMSVGMVQVRIT
jgi:hypothetical protein